MASVVEAFNKEIQPLLRDCPDVVVIDMADVELVDSAGLGVLIDVHDCLNNSDRKLIVINASDNVYGVFRAIKLDQMFTWSAPNGLLSEW